jgi:hypothetical protein
MRPKCDGKRDDMILPSIVDEPAGRCLQLRKFGANPAPATMGGHFSVANGA